MRHAVVLALALLTIGCGHGGNHASRPPVDRSEIAHIQVGSLPESPVLDWSPARSQWPAILATLPDQLPAPDSGASCSIGPTFVVVLRDGSEVDYVCRLPAAIVSTRNYVISLATEKRP